MKRILAYIGSGAGDKSHTYFYTKKILERIVSKRVVPVEYEILMPHNTNVLGCLSCNTCFNNLSCPLDEKDDMKIIKEKLMQADAIVLGSPLYLHNISGDTKRFIDRISYWAHLMKLSGKIGLAITSNMSNGHLFGIDYLDKVMTCLGVHVVVKDNVSLSMPGEFYSQDIIEERVEYYADLILSYFCNNHKIEVSDKMEDYFQATKNAVKSTQDTSNEEYNYWMKNEMFECEKFEDLLNCLNANKEE